MPDVGLFGQEIDEAATAKERYGLWPFTVWDVDEASSIRTLRRSIGDVGANGGGRHEIVTAYNFQAGGSVFNPAVAVWLLNCYAPQTGLCFDPFAGGGTRAIMAAKHGLAYLGVELRRAECEAVKQRCEANGVCCYVDLPEHIPIKVSATWATTNWHGCDAEYIRDVCYGRCCEGGDGKLVICTLPGERTALQERGATIEQGKIQAASTGKCPFKTGEHLCRLHGGPKPFGCIASPFTVNDHDTLIVRHRYVHLPCFKDYGTQPAYMAFRASLDLIFGVAEAGRVCDALHRDGTRDVDAAMPRESYDNLRKLDAMKKDGAPMAPRPNASGGEVFLRCGDVRDCSQIASDASADFLLTCPPYWNLEQYRGGPADLSMCKGYGDFLKGLNRVVLETHRILKPGAVSCWVVGLHRQKDGELIQLHHDVTSLHRAAGFRVKEEIVLNRRNSGAGKRVHTFDKGDRRLIRTHEYALVFVR
jgi:DNA modification methylase